MSSTSSCPSENCCSPICWYFTTGLEFKEEADLFAEEFSVIIVAKEHFDAAHVENRQQERIILPHWKPLDP
ncbi:MAG: hypothetical protein U0936_28055 [Planctomycetaceae bacterium]